MPIIHTEDLKPGDHTNDVYNGLDCCVTFEVFEALTKVRKNDQTIYSFERALQAPFLEMIQRGFLVDPYERRKSVDFLRGQIDRLFTQLQELAFAVWGKPLNPRSPKQLIDFFYGAMRLPEQWTSKKGERKLSTDRETLEKLEVYFHARPIIAHILAIRDAAKQLEVFETEVDPDGRMRTSYNIAGTETGRASSSGSSTGTGRNLQNIAGKLRRMFIADPGWKLCGIDLEQAESREVGWLCGVLFDDWSYLDACYAGDLHTVVTRLGWPQLPWTGDNKKDRAIAEQSAYRDLSYRDLAKKLGHGSNYFGQPFTMARHAKIPVATAENFQKNYFSGFPGIPKYHKYVAQQLQVTQTLVTPFGRERKFFGRPNDDTTLREAIAYTPQSSTADRLNLALYRIWSKLGPSIRLTAQVHDAVYFQYREEDEPWVIDAALALIETPMEHKGHKLVVPGEAKIGWNWANQDPRTFSDGNPDGLIKWKGSDSRSRTTLLERAF